MEKNRVQEIIRQAKKVGIPSEAVLDLISDDKSMMILNACLNDLEARMDDPIDEEEEETEDDEQTTMDDVRSEVYQMSERIAMLSPLATEAKAEIGDVRRRLEEMRLKLDLLQQNILDTTKEIKEQFTGFEGLTFANQQLQEGIKELRLTNQRITSDNISLRSEREVLKKGGGCYHNQLTKQDEERIEKEHKEIISDD